MEKHKALFVITLFCTTILLLPQTLLSQEKKESGNFKVKTDQEAHYAKGDQELIMYFYNNITFTEEAISAKLDDEVKVSFTVLPDGSVTDVAILKKVGYGLDEKVKQLLEKLKFEPAIQNGTKVPSSVIYAIPMRAS